MKVLLFHIGRERYALPLVAVARVLPVAQLKPLPGAPSWVPGLLDLHGAAVPVVDLSRLAGHVPEAVRYDTRILLVDYPLGDGRTRALGLKAERVTGVSVVPDAQFGPCGVTGAPWLGPVASVDGAMLQLVTPSAMLTDEVRALLFPEETPA
jgi:chemotaxis-related protein WspB